MRTDGEVSIEDFSSIQEDLYAAVIADVLDELGYRHQAMDGGIRPMATGLKLAGRAFTVHAIDVYEVPEKPYEKELEAVDRLSTGDVLVATTGGSTSSGFWGELLTTAALSKGARGAIIDGLARDSQAIIELEFPTFLRGYCPLDSKGRADVLAYGVPIECGGVAVRTGDFIFADNDGVIVAPNEVAEEAIQKAREKVSDEDRMRRALKEGMGVVEAYNKFRIL